MIHNVDSYTTNVTTHDHNVTNCIHDHSKATMEGSIGLKSAGQVQAAEQKIAEVKMSSLEYLLINIKKAMGNGLGFLRGIWNESADAGEKTEVIDAVEKEEEIQHGTTKAEEMSVVNLSAMESVADVKIQKKAEAEAEPERWKLSAAIPALKVKTGQARERFEAGKDAFLKRMKEMAKSRKKHSFEENKEERPGQQEKDMEWFEMGNSHLLDSYDKNGEYTNLGNRKEGQGYSGSPMKDNYSKKV